jgi:tetratricopeptide (TPR) repeat protein
VRGDYVNAERLLRRALSGARHGVDLTAVHNELGMTLRYAGRFDEAGDCYRRALDELARQHTPDHSGLATVHHNISGLAHARGDLAAAELSARAALALRAGTAGAEHPATLADQGALAAVLVSRGALDEALALLHQVLVGVERIYGTAHHEVAVVLHNLGSAAHLSGSHPHAAALLTRSLAVKEVTLGRTHPELAVTLCNLGLAHHWCGRTDLALTHLRRAIDVLEPVVDPEHPVLTGSRQALAALSAPIRRRRSDPPTPPA